jgi:PAS domain S-box-containing protein
MLSKANLSNDTLAAVIAQSIDCVKLIDLNGCLLWMNPNGLCSMEIDDICLVEGKAWAGLWPTAAREQITAALEGARTGQTARFEAYCPTAKGTQRWWDVSVSSVKDASGVLVGFLSISRDVTDAKMAREARDIMLAEMRHRLRNTFAISCSLLKSFARGNPEREGFAQEMSDRLIALAKAQTLFQDDDLPCQLVDLATTIVKPFDGPHCHILFHIAPETLVSRSTADVVALVLGELAVNSGKHGALSNGGSIVIEASQTKNQIDLIWTEQSAGPVLAHTRNGGQGLKLIERILASRQGTLKVDWRDDGLIVAAILRADLAP